MEKPFISTDEEGPAASLECKEHVDHAFDSTMIVHYEFVLQYYTVNQHFYEGVLHHLQEAVKFKHSGKWCAGDYLLHYDSASAHTALCRQQYLAKNNVAVVHHPLYSPDLAPSDFFLFQSLKLKLKGKRFRDCDIFGNSTQIERGTCYKKLRGSCFKQLRNVPEVLPAMAESLTRCIASSRPL
jgi:hypothetical protein